MASRCQAQILILWFFCGAAIYKDYMEGWEISMNIDTDKMLSMDSADHILPAFGSVIV